jgi:hypothetical protein
MRAVRLLFSMIFAIAVIACRRPSPDERVDGWKFVRAALTDGKECFAGRPEYCITDPEVVDAAVMPRLKVLYDGEMPERDIKVWALARAAAREYRRLLTRPENLARVEDLVRERYNAPVVSTDGTTVHVDMGVVPGKILAVEANHTLYLAASEDERDGLWSDAEARRVIADYAGRYPDKPDVEVKVTVGVVGPFDRLVYKYRSEAHRIFILSDDGEAWTTEPLRDGVAGIEAALLKRAELVPCRAPDGASPLDECEPIRRDAEDH